MTSHSNSSLRIKTTLVTGYIRLYMKSIWKRKLVPQVIVFSIARFYSVSDSWNPDTSHASMVITNNGNGSYLCVSPSAYGGLVGNRWMNAFGSIVTEQSRYIHWRLQMVNDHGNNLELETDARTLFQTTMGTLIGVIAAHRIALVKSDFADDHGHGYAFDAANGKVWAGSAYSDSRQTNFTNYAVGHIVHVILDLRSKLKPVLEFYLDDEVEKKESIDISSDDGDEHEHAYCLAVSTCSACALLLLPEITEDDVDDSVAKSDSDCG